MAGVGIVLIVVAVVVVAAASRGPRPGSATDVPQQMLTLDSTTLANLTRLPHAVPLSGDAAAPYVELGKQVDACADYDETHRFQMHQHLNWLLDPATIPSNTVAIALGSDPTGRLILGMGSFTANQWQQIGLKPGSCLIPIGKRLNEMLANAGETQFKVFQ